MAGEDVPLSDLLQCLVECSHKAARIAQLFREENDLFQLLVQEKAQIEINQQFIQDFKTLADVLVQETIRKDVGEKFPGLISNIRGEEQNSFENSLGECIRLEITSRPEDTVALLSKVLDGRDRVAKTLAEAVHSSDRMERIQYSSSSLIPADTIGIWIDPIDSTAEYIKAKVNVESENDDIQRFGLKCVCVLIGCYDLRSGRPLLGVVNQPFYSKDAEGTKWESRSYWSVNYNSECATSPTLLSDIEHEKKRVLISNYESKELLDAVASKYQIIHTAGAGHKCLLVACRKADLYVLSHETTYFWDTCGPHALLAAQGGGIIKFKELFRAEEIRNADDLRGIQIKYLSEGGKDGTESFRNAGGIIAYRDPEVVLDLLQLLYTQYISPK